MNIRCDYQNGEKFDDRIIVESRAVSGEVKITIIKHESFEYEFITDGPSLIRAIRRCIEEGQ